VFVDRVPAGNIGAISGLPLHVGETVGEAGIEVHSFEGLQYVSDPVVTVAVEPEDVKDLPLFDKVMHKLTTEDPNLHFVMNKESGESYSVVWANYTLKSPPIDAGIRPQVKLSKPISSTEKPSAMTTRPSSYG
jgi:hypothetical protein